MYVQVSLKNQSLQFNIRAVYLSVESLQIVFWSVTYLISLLNTVCHVNLKFLKIQNQILEVCRFRIGVAGGQWGWCRSSYRLLTVAPCHLRGLASDTVACGFHYFPEVCVNVRGCLPFKKLFSLFKKRKRAVVEKPALKYQ